MAKKKFGRLLFDTAVLLSSLTIASYMILAAVTKSQVDLKQAAMLALGMLTVHNAFQI